jgi:hypothetical protein
MEVLMKITNHKDLPAVIVRALEADKYDGPSWADWPRFISGTTLIGPPQIAYYKSKHDKEIEQDASDMIYALQGRAMHSILESGKEDKGLYEYRMSREILGSIVTAQLDQFEDGVLRDYKWTESPYKKVWEEQLNVEVWLLENLGHVVDRLEVVALRRGRFDIFTARLWSPDERAKYVAQRVTLHQNAAYAHTRCTDEEIWGGKRCEKYCLVSRWCTQYLEKKRK